MTFSKPINKFDHKRLDGKELYWTVKMNGRCHPVTRSGKKIWIQTRDTMEDVTDKYPHLVPQFRRFMPNNSIVLAELYVGDGITKEEFRQMGSIANSLPERARSQQKKIGLVKAYVYRAPFWNGDCTSERGHICRAWLEFLSDRDSTKHITPVFGCVGTPEQAAERLRQEPWEGYVAYDPLAVLGKNAFNWIGREGRPKVAWKLKRIEVIEGAGEDDFIAHWDPEGSTRYCCPNGCPFLYPDALNPACSVCGAKTKAPGTWGTGKHRKAIGAISLFQINARGEYCYIGNVSSGLSDDQKRQLNIPSCWPRIVQVKFQGRQYRSEGADNNALDHAVLLEFRSDKKPEECINADL